MQYPKPAESHFIIGLTGNIGTGKSLVRKMLEHSGALGIDADRLTHDLLKEGSPASRLVIAEFGAEILSTGGTIDRKKLGEIVFSDPRALKRLESILHPLVSAAIRNIVALSPIPVVVVEAIKLLESDLAGQCQTIWVVDAGLEEIFKRLEKSRGMTRAQVELRQAQQSPAAEKIQHADVVIHNSADTRRTWQQVRCAWDSIPEAYNSSSSRSSLPDRLKFLSPNEQSIDLLSDFLGRHPHSAIHMYIKETIGKNFTGDLEQNQRIDREALLQSLLSYHFIQGTGIELALWDINHFNCRMGGYSLKDSEKAHGLKKLISAMENYGKFHLCSAFSVPFNKEDATLYEVMGYHKQPIVNARRQVSGKAGYNLYTKIYPSAFEL